MNIVQRSISYATCIDRVQKKAYYMLHAQRSTEKTYCAIHMNIVKKKAQL